MNDVVIEVDSLRKEYGSFVAVDDVSFRVHQGEVFGLLGPNGAGKTSTLETLEGLRPPDGGSIRVAGVDPTSDPRRLRNIIGVQAYHGVEPRLDLLERLGLGEKLATQYYQLSVGQQRRLALALAVAHEPPVLFLDEPSAGLDVASRADIHDLMRELQERGTTIILATHDMAEAEEMSDRVAILLRGVLVATGTPLDLTAAGGGLTKVSVRTVKSSLISAAVSFPGVKQETVKGEYSIFLSSDTGATVGAIIARVEQSDDTLIDLRVERPSLEDRFLEVPNERIYLAFPRRLPHCRQEQDTVAHELPFPTWFLRGDGRHDDADQPTVPGDPHSEHGRLRNTGEHDAGTSRSFSEYW